MKALVIERQGGVEHLAWRDWPDPEPRPGDALVRVRAVGLNHLDVFVRRGMPGFPVKTPFISGGDIVGEIAALGAGVEGWRAGERVAINPMTPEGMMGEAIQGGMAELARAPATHLLRLPEGIDAVTAAAVPINYGTAHRMLFTVGALLSLIAFAVAFLLPVLELRTSHAASEPLDEGPGSGSIQRDEQARTGPPHPPAAEPAGVPAGFREGRPGC